VPFVAIQGTILARIPGRQSSSPSKAHDEQPLSRLSSLPPRLPSSLSCTIFLGNSFLPYCRSFLALLLVPAVSNRPHLHRSTSSFFLMLGVQMLVSHADGSWETQIVGTGKCGWLWWCPHELHPCRRQGWLR